MGKLLNMLFPKTTLNCAGVLLDVKDPLVMGILNLTPDSFYDGGRLTTEKSLLEQAGQMLEEGARILDIGGASSRPGAAILTPEQELARVLPAVKALRKTFPQAILSIDTYWAPVARATVEAGVQIVNDISAGSMDDQLWSTVAELKVPYVLMHMQGNPQNMQDKPRYQQIGLEIFDFFTQKIQALKALGIVDIILDPGFGFGKTIANNYELLNAFPAFQILDAPLLAGLSRKSMIYKTLDISPAEALNGTTALHMVALQHGAKILRVHDVKAAQQTIALFQKLTAHATNTIQ